MITCGPSLIIGHQCEKSLTVIEIDVLRTVMMKTAVASQLLRSSVKGI